MENNAQDDRPIAIEDAQVDPQEIMSEIRSQLNHLRYFSYGEGGSKRIYKAATYPQKPDDIPYDLALYQLLDRLKRDHRQTNTELDLRESKIGRLPIIGRFWRALQRALHGPAHYYANRTAERQAEINSQMFQIISKLMAANQEQQRQIIRLEEKLNQLFGEGQ